MGFTNFPPSAGIRPIVAKTANSTLGGADSGVLLTNQGASGAVTFTLPAPQLGLTFSFCAVAAQNVVVTTPSGSIFGSGSLSGASRTISGSVGATQYGSITLTCYDGANWLITSGFGVVT